MRDLQTEIECIYMRLEILIDEAKQLYKLLDNFRNVNNEKIENVENEVMERLEKRRLEITCEITNLTNRVKKINEY